VLDYVDGGANLHAISLAHGKESIDVPLLRDRLANQFNSAAVQGAFKRSSGLIPFHTWVATQDLKDEHLVVEVDSGGAYNVAAIDFAYSLGWEQPDGGPVQPPGGPPSLVANADKNVVEVTVAEIEAVSDDEIRSFVDSLPGELISDDEKHRVADGLIQRWDKVRETMKAQGWLP
jgi:hypothetical protein